MKTTIIIKKGKEEEEIKVGGYFLILSDPNDFQGVTFRSSTISVPRQLGWVEWAKLSLENDAKKCFFHVDKYWRSVLNKYVKKIKQVEIVTEKETK